MIFAYYIEMETWVLVFIIIFVIILAMLYYMYLPKNSSSWTGGAPRDRKRSKFVYKKIDPSTDTPLKKNIRDLKRIVDENLSDAMRFKRESENEVYRDDLFVEDNFYEYCLSVNNRVVAFANKCLGLQNYLRILEKMDDAEMAAKYAKTEKTVKSLTEDAQAVGSELDNMLDRIPVEEQNYFSNHPDVYLKVHQDIDESIGVIEE